MKKNFKSYVIVWVIGLAIFNLCAFLVPSPAKFTPSFWLGYGFITLAFILHLGTAYFTFKEETKEKLFLNISTITINFITLVCTAIVAAITMVSPGFPDWLGAILCFACFGIGIAATLLAKTAGDMVAKKDEKIKAQTFFIKSLTVDAESLISRAKSENIKAECKKVYEAVRYSDPMNSAALASIESDITIKFSKFSEAVISEDSVTVATLADEIIILLGDRNKKCRLLK